MLTGAKSVIVSLWSVESESTAVLMKMFYAHLRAGKNKEEALRLAKQELRGSVFGLHRERKIDVVPRKGKTEYSSAHPFFWAPFILMGEWE
jgi:CHAT domain-containing protein